MRLGDSVEEAVHDRGWPSLQLVSRRFENSDLSPSRVVE
jgi:hypothetical protein